MLPGGMPCHSPCWACNPLPGGKCCTTGVVSDCDQTSSSISERPSGRSKYPLPCRPLGEFGLCPAAAASSRCFWICLGTYKNHISKCFASTTSSRPREILDATPEHPKLSGPLRRTFPRLFFSRLYWQTYSSSMQREQGDCPLHLVRMRWQWSHARLTLRLTGAEPLRSCFGMSAAAGSIVAAASEVRWG